MRPAEETRPAEEANQVPPAASAFQPSTSEGRWERVERKKRKKKKRKDGSQHGPPPSCPNHANQQTRSQPKPLKKVRRLRPPRSAAVVITLKPGAEERGASYASVIKEAQRSITLADVGASAVRFKVAATGGRILEFSGASGGAQADSFAQKLREVVSEENVRVSRPNKCVDMRISGLDDSVRSDDVATAVAQKGGCASDEIRASKVTRDFSGLGTVWLRCPVAAAKKVVESGRLLVGWVSARVKLLDERPQRCYRCLQRGHLRAQCNSEVDRSDTCYRCGQAGHKAQGCSAAPYCSVCAAAGRPAGHRGGGGACKQPKKPKRSGKADDGPRVSSQSAGPSMSTRAEEIPMTVEQ